MKKQRKPKGFWSLENCKTDAKKYETRKDWEKNSPGGYMKAQRNGWLDKCCRHMTYLHRPHGYWTKEACIKEAKKYKTRRTWELGSGVSYHKSRRMGWMDVCCKHMEVIIKPKGYWGFEACKADAKKFKTRTEWSLKSGSAYNKAHKNGWLDDCTKHMVIKK